MTTTKLIYRSLFFYARSNLGVLLGAAIGSAVLIGALLVGDSVRESLRGMALARLGQTQVALLSNDRVYQTQLADDLAAGLQRPVAPVLIYLGTASAGGGKARANDVQVLGVNEAFWSFAPQPPAIGPIAKGSVVLNRQLAAQLEAKAGDSILLRVPQPSQLSRDAPMAPEEDSSIALRVDVQAVVDDQEMGRFSLKANQIASFNAFVNLGWLQDKLGIPGRLNLTLIGGETVTGEDAKALIAQASGVVKQHWTLADAQLELVKVPNLDDNLLELRTDRVFLEDPVINAATRAAGDAREILTYFVNRITSGGKMAPYSMVTAAGVPLVPELLGENEILINQWLADDLGAHVGDEVSLAYFVMNEGRKAVERTNTFSIRAIVPLTGEEADPTLMPDFPGMTDAKNCRDWDTGFDMDLDLIRQQDNQYWVEHKGTPKAFISLAAGQKLWSNRFGSLTAVRFPAGGTTPDELGAKILAGLDPEALGMVVTPVRELALTAVNKSEDFGGLFIGFSFFLIIAALLLMSLLFQFGVEQRAREIGTLLAVGFQPKQVRRCLLVEGTLISVVGGVIGLLGGVYYAKAMLWGLGTLWVDAVGTSALVYAAKPASLATGFVSGVLVAVFSIWLALRKQARQPAHLLLAAGAEAVEQSSAGTARKRARRNLWIGAGSTVTALALVAWVFASGDLNAEMFFSAGSLLLIGGLAFAARYVATLDEAHSEARPSVAGLGLRNAARRSKRSLATVAMLACGSFLVVSIGAFRIDPLKDADKRPSGTGGFAFIGQSTLPVSHDLNTRKAWDFYGLSEKDMTGVSFVSFRVRDGEEASCLNLNQAQRPRIIGVDPQSLAGRQAFTFAKTAGEGEAESPWSYLNGVTAEGAIPAIADINSILWAMGKSVGQVFEYPSPDDNGQPLKIKLVGGVAGSIMQGSLIISEQNFIKLFPNEEGYRMFLVDAPAEGRDQVREKLTRGLQDAGLELNLATQRLAEYSAVENTYLSTFQVLGGLGLLLGSVGLGVVVLRNVLERRSELAVLTAVGFRKQTVQWFVISEHGALLVLGLGVGVISALVAVLPAVLTPGGGLPYGSLILTLGAVFASGALWTWISAVVALRGQLLSALRNE